MSEARLFAFEGSSLSETLKDKVTFLKSATRNAFRSAGSEFIVFVDYPTLDKYSAVLDGLKSNNHFKGLVLSIEPHLFSLSFRVLQKQLSASLFKRLATVESEEAIKRFVHAWTQGGQEVLIGDFKVDPEGRFFLLDCRMGLHTGVLKNLEVFKDAALEQLQNFELDEFGNYIYWPELDVHLDLDSFKRELYPEFRKKEIAKALARTKRFGARMKAYRLEQKKRQSDFDGLSDKQIRRYESGEMAPTYKAIASIADAFGLQPSEYIDAIMQIEI